MLVHFHIRLIYAIGWYDGMGEICLVSTDVEVFDQFSTQCTICLLLQGIIFYL